MKQLEDTKCEVRRCIDLQLSIWDKSNGCTDDEAIPPIGSPGYNGSFARLGNFFEDATYAWLSCGARLVVVNVKTGTSISSWTFRDKVTCVAAFPAQAGQVPLLLVGLDNGASRVRDSAGLLCVFDCTTSQVLRAIRMPAGVEQVCIVTGGAEWEDFGDKRVENFIRDNSGIACVALRNLHHLIVDLRRTSWEGPDADETIADESSPAELDFSERNETSRHKFIREKHVAYNFIDSRLEQYIGFNREEFESSSLYRESLTSSMICCRKIGCLISGCLGRIIIWQLDGSVRWVSPPMEENMSVSHLALLEPTDDPRPFCYLWAGYQEENSRLPPILRMYAMLFERKYSDKGGTNAYFNLENDPSMKFELELDEGNSITSLCPIIRESNPEQTESGNKRGEDSLLLISLAKNQTLLFDLNQWYKEQMPHTIGESQNPNTFIASYRTRNNRIGDENIVINACYQPASLKEFPSNVPTPAEEIFFPNSLSLEWIEVSTDKLTFWMTRGLQTELLREMSMAGPVILIEPTETFTRCLSAGLISSGAEVSFTSSKDLQRECLLSLCLEQRWSQFLLKCANDWSDGSASYLFHAFIRWGMERASSIKFTAHRLCIPLYDGSESSIGEAEVKTLRLFAQQLECLSNVVAKLLIDSVDLTKQKRALGRVSTYLQVLLWFYDVGLLPETQELEDEATLPLGFSMKIPFPFERLATIYREKRQEFRSKMVKDIDEEHHLFIDELVGRECAPLKSQWEREGGELSAGGNYPPPSLQSLLRSYLTDCYSQDSDEMNNKHQITIYLLMDLAMLLPSSCPGVEQLIKYPSAFKLSPSLIKLTQALWHLDHEDYHGFLDMMTGQLVCDSDVKDWHHKFVMRTLIRNNQNKLALIYLRVRKPPLSSLDDQGTVITLSVQHGLVQSAFHRRPPSHYTQLLTRFFQACKIYGKLNDILHLALDTEEEEAFVKFLENSKSDDTRLLYYLQRSRYAEASTVYPISLPSGRGHFSNNKQPASQTIFTAYNATLPEITRKFSSNMNSRVLEIDADSRFPRPMSHSKSRAKIREIHEMVIRKAKETFLRGKRSHVPFISAPCLSLRTNAPNVDNNSVLFVERSKKPYGKRTLDDSHHEDQEIVGYNNGEERKRRKTDSKATKPDETDGNEVGMSMVFDTPLVKRKNQIINARDTPAETPHSILKIRQMIRDSTSPTISKAVYDEIAEEKERKPRQIRFSIGRQRADTPIDDKAEDMETEESLAQGDVSERNFEAEKSAATISGSSATPSEEEDEEKEVFFSPNVTTKSLSESTILSDSSFASRNVSAGPRPRPSLRRSNPLGNDSSSDLLRRSLTKSSEDSKKRSWTPTLSDSTKISGDLSISGDKSIVTNSRRASMLSNSIYSTSILSSDTSFENVSIAKYDIKRSETIEESSVSSFVERSVERCRDFGSVAGIYENSDNFSRFSRQFGAKSSLISSIREYSVDNEEDKNSEVLMEVDRFGLDRDSDTRSRADLEFNMESGERRDNVELPLIQSSTILEESRTESFHDPPEDQAERLDNEEGNEENRSKIISQKTESQEFSQRTEETESIKPSDDYDDELMALKYVEDDEDDDDEENEEVFQSLSNTLETENEERQSEKSIGLNDYSTENNVFNKETKIASEELNMTDDESSRSGETSLANDSTAANNDVLEKTISIEKLSRFNSEDNPNITDDESNSTYDSSQFSQPKNSSRGDSERVTNEEDSSFDSSIFSTRKNVDLRKKSLSTISKSTSDEIVPSSSSLTETVASSNVESEHSERESESSENWPVKKGRKSTRLSKIGSGTPGKSKSPRANEETTENVELTPTRITRSRRASSVSQQLPASPLPESPLVKTRLRRASSLATEVFPSPDKKVTRTVSAGLESPMKKGGLRRSVSLAKEIFAAKALDESQREDELPVRRSARQTASAQSEILEAPKTPVKVTRSSSKASLTEETAEELPVVAKRTRGRRANSVSKDSEIGTTKKSTRASSLAKETLQENELPESGKAKRSTRGSSTVKKNADESEEISETTTKRVTRKRANSVPKESEIPTRNSSLRARRGSSVSKDVIIEESNESIGEIGKSKSGKSTTAKIASPANSRTRLSSISSIPEEEEDDIFDVESKGKTSEKKRPSSARERRAVSVDPPQVEIKRRTRAGSIKSAISEDTIEEEPSEGEIAEETKSKAKKRKAPVRRKRTVSATAVDDEEAQQIVEKLPQRRTRKVSQKSTEATESFRFSPPDQAQDGPDDDHNEMGDIPDYVFSPPHTRSKHQPSTQPRRQIKDFIPLTEKEKMAEKRVAKPRVTPLMKATKSRNLWDPHGAFVLPKRHKSTTD